MKFRDKQTGEIVASPIEVLRRSGVRIPGPLGHQLRVLQHECEDLGYNFVYDGAQPDHDKKNQHLEEGPVTFADGKWQTTWEVKPGKDPNIKEPKPGKDPNIKEPKPRPGRGGMGFGRRFSY